MDQSHDAQPPSRERLICPSCHSRIPVPPEEDEQQAFYCIHCGTALAKSGLETLSVGHASAISSSFTDDRTVALIRGHAPAKEEVKFSIGPYQILRSIGKGGMGEVFLAYDTSCGRRIALKRIREDLVDMPSLHNRFLKEARITSQLTHPAIIPIYSIHASEGLIYYTMPYVEGETLRQIIRTTRDQMKEGKPLHHLGGSIPSLIRIFISVCQAVAYAHSKDVLHRDLKPENIIIGPYGEVMILDWGLAKLLDTQQADEEEPQAPTETKESSLTHMGKVVGTIPYMAPERALGSPATVSTDLYALGVILYQILALHHPFRRPSLKDLRRNWTKEVFIDPARRAPYREVPPTLSRMCQKSLMVKPGDRYHSTEELIHDLEVYIEGRSEWLFLTDLDIANKHDWEFQEHVMVADQIEVTRHNETSDWFSLMVSHQSFPENSKVEATVQIGTANSGIGFLMNMPEASSREHILDGYCLWIGSEEFRDTKLLRSTVEVMQAPEVFLKPGIWYRLRIEKIENNIHFYLDDQLQMSYISHLPLAGTHIGFMSRDANFMIGQFTVYGGSQNLKVSCLAVPDAFLAYREYDKALVEYRRIAHSFPGQAEGREGLFRAGITLLEKARHTSNEAEMDALIDQALEEFAKLHATPGAPMEYVGKALVYQTLGDYAEEAKCFELALRRYPKHPLSPILQEKIAYRMHESARKNRIATYAFVLLVLRHLPEISRRPNTQRLFLSLQRHWQPLPFMEAEGDSNVNFAITLAFWLAKPLVLGEIIDEFLTQPGIDGACLGNALFGLIQLGSWKLAQQKLLEIRSALPCAALTQLKPCLELIDIALLASECSLPESAKRLLALEREQLQICEMRVYHYLMEKTLLSNSPKLVHELTASLSEYDLAPKDRILVATYQIGAYLAENDLAKAGQLLYVFPAELLSDEQCPLYFMYGCWLRTSEGAEIAHAHFSGVMEVPYPHSWSLGSYYLTHKLDDRWFSKSFLWERRHLYQQLSLFFHCANDLSKAEHFLKKAKTEIVFE